MPSSRTLRVLTTALLTSSLAVVPACEDAPESSAGTPTTERPTTVAPAAAAAPTPGTTGVNAPPPLVATPATVDFGIVEPGSELEAEITLANTTDRPVRILRAQPSCTCTTVDMDGVVVPARGSVQMPLAMTTNRSVGRKIARVQLLIEGHPRPIVVGLDAENAWAVRAIPPHLAVRDRADQPERRVGTFALESTDQRPFRVLSVLGGAPDFVGFDPDVDEPRSRYELRYDFTGLDCASIPPFLIVHTDHPKAPLLDLRVRHDPCTKIQTAMPMADFRSNLGEVRTGQRIELPLLFKKPRRPVMTSVTCSDPGLRVRMIDQTSDGSELQVLSLVEITKDLPEGLFQIPITYSDGVSADEHLLYGWKLP